MDDKPKPVSDSVSQVLAHLGAAPVSATKRLPVVWEEVVGRELAARTEPGRLADGVLTVHVTDPAVDAELRFRASEVAEALARELGSDVVYRLRITRRPR